MQPQSASCQFLRVRSIMDNQQPAANISAAHQTASSELRELFSSIKPKQGESFNIYVFTQNPKSQILGCLCYSVDVGCVQTLLLFGFNNRPFFVPPVRKPPTQCWALIGLFAFRLSCLFMAQRYAYPGGGLSAVPSLSTGGAV